MPVYRAVLTVEVMVQAPDRGKARAFIEESINEEMLTLHDANVVIEEADR